MLTMCHQVNSPFLSLVGLLVANASHGATVAFVIEIVFAIVVVAIDTAVPGHVPVERGGAPELRVETQVDQTLFRVGACGHRAETAFLVDGDRLRLPQGRRAFHHAARHTVALQRVEQDRPLLRCRQMPTFRTNTLVMIRIGLFGGALIQVHGRRPVVEISVLRHTMLLHVRHKHGRMAGEGRIVVPVAPGGGSGAAHILCHPALGTNLYRPVGVSLMVCNDEMALAWQTRCDQSVCNMGHLRKGYLADNH